MSLAKDILPEKVRHKKVHRNLGKLSSSITSQPFKFDSRLEMVLPLSRSAVLYLVLHFCKCNEVGSFSSILYCYKQFFGFGNPAISAISRAGF